MFLFYISFLVVIHRLSRHILSSIPFGKPSIFGFLIYQIKPDGDKIHRNLAIRRACMIKMELDTQRFIDECKHVFQTEVEPMESVLSSKHYQKAKTLLLINPQLFQIARCNNIVYITSTIASCSLIARQLSMHWSNGSGYDMMRHAMEKIIEKLSFGGKRLNDFQEHIPMSLLFDQDVKQRVIECASYLYHSERVAWGYPFPWKSAFDCDGLIVERKQSEHGTQDAHVEEQKQSEQPHQNSHHQELQSTSEQTSSNRRSFEATQSQSQQPAEPPQSEEPLIDAATVTRPTRVQTTSTVVDAQSHNTWINNSYQVLQELMLDFNEYQRLQQMWETLQEMNSNMQSDVHGMLNVKDPLNRILSKLKEYNASISIKIELIGQNMEHTLQQLMDFEDSCDFGASRMRYIMYLLCLEKGHHAQADNSHLYDLSDAAMKRVQRVFTFGRIVSAYPGLFWLDVSPTYLGRKLRVCNLMFLLDNDKNILGNNNNQNSNIYPYTAANIDAFRALF
eukprot:106087_1